MAIIKHKSQRVGIFIDTQNLYHSAKNLYKAKVNFGQVVKEAVAGRNLIRAIAYVIRTESEDEKGFFEALNKLGIETKVKDIRIFAGGAKKADWDIGMAIDAVAMGQKLDTIILATGSTVKIYKTWQAAVDAADAAAVERSILINAGDYSAEFVVIPATAPVLWCHGEAVNRVQVGGLELGSGTVTYFKNIDVVGGETVTGGADVEAHFEDCHLDLVDVDFLGASFTRCRLNYAPGVEATPKDVTFTDCDLTLGDGAMESHWFENCYVRATFESSSALLGLHFSNCDLEASLSGTVAFRKTGDRKSVV